jgi:hypothetical protein
VHHRLVLWPRRFATGAHHRITELAMTCLQHSELGTQFLLLVRSRFDTLTQGGDTRAEVVNALLHVV